VVLSVGDSAASAVVVATASWDDFQTVTAGRITVPASGNQTVRVKAVSKPGAGVVNLRSIVLR
jgi:predicted nucleic acid-binding Zn ribbon protein